RTVGKIGTMAIVAQEMEGKMPMETVVQLRAPESELPTVRGGRKPNSAFRSREYLTEAEIEQLRKAARKSRNPVRDELLVLLAYRHAPAGLRAGRINGRAIRSQGCHGTYPPGQERHARHPRAAGR